MIRARASSLCCSLLALVAACSASEGNTPTPDGFAAGGASGGSSSGGNSAVGGAVSVAGGPTASGGAQALGGGSSLTGGTSPAGGGPSSGGATLATGGAPRGGGTTNRGGSAGATPSSGGATPSSGGTANTTGGAATSGGATSRGGMAGSSGKANASGTSNASGGASTGGVAGSAGGTATGGDAGRGGSTGAVAPGLPIGYCTVDGGTTGGQAGDTVTARTFAELQSYAESSTPYVILVEGTLTNGRGGGRINVQSNKSIIGVGATAFLSGVGLSINNSSNIIIQNLRATMVGIDVPKDVNDGDIISISGTSQHIWVDHCELFSEDPDSQTDIDKYDGLIDIKGQTGFICVSYSYLHDHHKGGLVGAADDDLYDDRKVTFHHNYYRDVRLRVPMYRGSVGHFFNNYVVGADKASEIRAGTCLRVEKSYYDGMVGNRFTIYTTSDSAGEAERIDNIETSSRAYPSGCTVDIPYDYSDGFIDNTADVPTRVPELAGVGKL